MENIKFCLASDLDGTLIDPADGPAGRAGVAQLRRLRQENPRFKLAYVTGRHLELALDGMRSAGLPMPDYIAADVGTSMFAAVDGIWRSVDVYEEQMKALMGTTGVRLLDQAVLGDGVELQEPDRQAPFKRSYYLDLSIQPNDFCERLKEPLARQGIRIQPIYSLDEFKPRGLLDLLPFSAGKHSALRFLSTVFSLPESNCVFSGDSGNDLTALTSGYPAILVGNAGDQVRQALTERVERDPSLRDRVYLAERSFGEGIAEGLDHFGLL